MKMVFDCLSGGSIRIAISISGSEVAAAYGAMSEEERDVLEKAMISNHISGRCAAVALLASKIDLIKALRDLENDLRKAVKNGRV